jgi:uncharacterized protein (UPF0264 family)
MPISEIEDLCRQCRPAELPIALAGPLGPDQIMALSGSRLNWFAVRGAACEKGKRHATVEAGRVRDLVALLRKS